MALSFGSMIPFLGWASTGGKFVKRGSDLYEARNVVSTEKMKSIFSSVYQNAVNSSLGRTQNHLGFLPKNGYQFGTSNTLTFKMPSVKNDIPTSIKSGDVDVKTDIKNVDIEVKGTGKVQTGGRELSVDETAGLNSLPGNLHGDFNAMQNTLLAISGAVGTAVMTTIMTT